jgi:hypothetical protein
MGRRKKSDLPDFRCRDCHMKWSDFTKENTSCPKSLYEGKHDLNFSKPNQVKISSGESMSNLSNGRI